MFFDHLRVNTHGTVLIAEDTVTLLGSVPRTEKLEDTAFFVPLSCSSNNSCCAGQMYNLTAVPQAPSPSGKTQEVHTRVMLSSISLEIAVVALKHPGEWEINIPSPGYHWAKTHHPKAPL